MHRRQEYSNKFMSFRASRIRENENGSQNSAIRGAEGVTQRKTCDLRVDNLKIPSPLSPASPFLLFFKEENGSIQRKNLLPVFVNNIVNHLLGDTWEAGAFDDFVDFPLAGNNVFRGGGGEIGTEDQLVFDAIFDGGHESLVMSKRTVVQGGNVGVKVGVFANQHDAFVLPGVSHVRNDNA